MRQQQTNRQTDRQTDKHKVNQKENQKPETFCNILVLANAGPPGKWLLKWRVYWIQGENKQQTIELSVHRADNDK